MFVTLLGPPGSGKGTQGKMLAKRLGFHHMSTGDLLREKAKTDDIIRRTLERGELVSSKTAVRVLEEFVSSPGSPKKVILDGLPRNFEQIDMVEEALNNAGEKLDVAIYLDLPHNKVIDRLVNRWLCNMPDGKQDLIAAKTKGEAEGICSGTVSKRDDDNVETANKRLSVYLELTEPVVQGLEDKGILHKVDASKTPEEVYEEIKSILEK